MWHFHDNMSYIWISSFEFDLFWLEDNVCFNEDTVWKYASYLILLRGRSAVFAAHHENTQFQARLKLKQQISFKDRLYQLLTFWIISGSAGFSNCFLMSQLLWWKHRESQPPLLAALVKVVFPVSAASSFPSNFCQVLSSSAQARHGCQFGNASIVSKAGKRDGWRIFTFNKQLPLTTVGLSPHPTMGAIFPYPASSSLWQTRW